MLFAGTMKRALHRCKAPSVLVPAIGFELMTPDYKFQSQYFYIHIQKIFTITIQHITSIQIYRVTPKYTFLLPYATILLP